MEKENARFELTRDFPSRGSGLDTAKTLGLSPSVYASLIWTLRLLNCSLANDGPVRVISSFSSRTALVVIGTSRSNGNAAEPPLPFPLFRWAPVASEAAGSSVFSMSSRLSSTPRTRFSRIASRPVAFSRPPRVVGSNSAPSTATSSGYHGNEDRSAPLDRTIH